MLAYRRQLKIQYPQHVLLSDLPVKAGQQVEILILVKDDMATLQNPAESYTDTQWQSLSPESFSELETQYVLNNPILMSQIQTQSQHKQFTQHPSPCASTNHL